VNYVVGLVITDDKIALNEIAWQLGVENAGSNRTFVSFCPHDVHVKEEMEQKYLCRLIANLELIYYTS
jgi:hypothetical protein